MNRAVPKLRIAMIALFAIELVAGAVAVSLYDGAMSVSFLVALPLLGLLQSGMLFRRQAPYRMKLFILMQTLLFVLPPAVYAVYQPDVSYEEAVDLVHAYRQDDIEPAAGGGKRYMSLANSGNPFVSKGYVIVVPTSDGPAEYVVHPVSGEVFELE